MASLNGLAYQYLWPDNVYWHNEGFHIVFLLMAITALLFSRLFLKTADWSPRTDRWMRWIQWVLAAAILLRLAGYYVPVLYVSYAALLLLLLLSVLGYMAYRHGVYYARWYSVAWVFYGVGLLISVLSAGSSLFSWGMAPLVYAQTGGFFEAVFLLVAMGERLLGWDRDRRHALEIANQDPLTKLGNRRALEEALNTLRDDIHARDGLLYLILIDLDHFKEINDRYGHDAGDYVLVEMGQLLRRVCRPEDICLRLGGEEFAVLLQVPGEQQARDIAERIRSEFAEMPTIYEGNSIQHTLTAGLSQPISAKCWVNQAELLRQADSAMYQAKHAGRNQTGIFE